MQLDFDVVLKGLGSTGRYQICQYIWLLSSFLTIVFGILGYVFIGKNVPYQCAPLSAQSFSDILASLGIPIGDVVSSSTVINECTIDVTIVTTTGTQSVTVGCVDGVDFGPQPFTSVVSEFSLVCERLFLSRLPLFLLLASQALGAIVIPLLADRLGRKPLLLIAHTAAFLLTVSMAFPRSVELFTVLKTLSGAFIEGLLLVSVTMAVELTQVKDRKLASLGIILAWFMSGLTLVAISFGLRLNSWRILQYALAAGSIALFFQIFIIEESIRWLLAVGREREALALITYAAKANNVDVNKVLGDATLTTVSSESVTSTSSGTIATEPVTSSSPDVGPTEPVTSSSPDVSSSEPAILSLSDLNPTKPVISSSSEVNPTESLPLYSVEVDPTEFVTRSSHDVNSADVASSSEANPVASVTRSSSERNPTAPSTESVIPSDRVADSPGGTTAGTATKSTAIIKLVTCCQIGSNKHLLSNTFIFIYIWLVLGFAYYGLYFTSSVFSSDIYLNFTVNVLSELPAALIIVFGIDSIGRKKVMYTFLVIAVGFLTLASIVTVFAGVDVKNVLLPIFGLLGKLGVAGAFFTMVLYTGETYPTSFRLIGLGIASVSGRIGALGAPFLVFTGESLAYLPTALISGLLLIAVFAVFPLPETKGKELPQTLEDVENLYH